MTSTDHGRASIEPQGEVVAGSYGTWRLTYAIGARGLATGGKVRITTDSDTDWGWPQCEDAAAADYITLQAPPDAEAVLVIENHKSVLVAVTGRVMEPGERLVITYGDVSGDGPGSRAQTFVEARRYFLVDVDAEGRGEFQPIEDHPYVSVVGGPPVRLRVVAPSSAVAGKPFRVFLKAEDAWGNPAAYAGQVRLEFGAGAAPAQEISFTAADGGAKVVDGCVIAVPGVHRLSARDAAQGFSASSNPLHVSGEEPEYRLFWGDPHGGQVMDARKIGDYFRYARDVSAIDFVGYQRNDDEMTDDAYALQQRFEREHHAPGRFVPLPGYEWTGEAWVGGHHNVYTRRFDQPLLRSGHPDGPGRGATGTELPHILDVFRRYRGADVVITPHVGGGHSDLTYHEPTLEPAMEMTSTHGSFEWFLREAYERRYEIGMLGGSDCYTGRPGDDYPGHQLRRYAKSGLTGLYARELTVQGVLEAMKARRCYATTGARIIAALTADGHWMGTKYTTGHPPELRVAVTGTAPLERVEVYRGLTRIHAHDLPLRDSPRRVRILWEGASRKSSYSGVIWTGTARLSGGTIDAVKALRFDSPRSHVERLGLGALRWESWACGYQSGLVLDIDGPDDVRLEVAVASRVINGARYGGYGEAPPGRMSFAPAERMKLDVRLSDLRAGARTIDLGILDRKVTIGLAPEGATDACEFSVRDPSIVPGVNPYWVKVLQADMEAAWTSAVFVDYAPSTV